MGRMVVMNHLSLDGVMQGPGRADADTRGGFTRGGWGEISATPDNPAAEAMGARMAAGGGLAGWLFGWRTYQDLLTVRNARGGPFAGSLNATTTYVASSTLTEPLPWPGSTLLAGDVVAAVRHVTAQTEGVLGIMGGGVLVRSLMTANLVDGYLLMIHPLVLGAGLTVSHLTAQAGGQQRLPGSAGTYPWRPSTAPVRRDGVVQAVARGSQPRTDWLPGVSRSFP